MIVSTEPAMLLIVIVNYRTASLVVECLASLEGEVRAMAGVHVVVTDNASGDGSVERLRQEVRDRGWEGWATIQPLGRNGGFAWGNNEAIRPALASATPPRYVLLLNPDTIVRPGCPARSGRVHGRAARDRDRRQPARRPRRYAATVGLPVPFGSRRVRGRASTPCRRSAAGPLEGGHRPRRKDLARLTGSLAPR